MEREDMKGLSLSLNIKCSNPLTKAWWSVWNKGWVNMVGLCEHFGTSLAMVIRRSHWCGLYSVVLLWHWLHFYLSHSITIPSGHSRFCCHSSEERIHFWGLQSWFERSNLPYSSCSSKDSEYSDCQLGVPMRAIRSQRKIDVSKRDIEESAVLWRVLKYFMSLDYNASYRYLWY